MESIELRKPIAEKPVDSAQEWNATPQLTSFPGLFVAVLPDEPRFTVVSASDAYLCATNLPREQIVGKGLFEAFSQQAHPIQFSTLVNLRASFERVLATGQPDGMPVQRYDLPRAEGGGLEQRYWRPLNSPLPAPDGAVQFIFHSVEDVTGFVHAEQSLKRSEARHQLSWQLMVDQRATENPEIMMQAAADAVGRFLNVDRVGFFEMRGNILEFGVGWVAGRLPLLTGLLPGVAIGTGYLKEVQAGRTMGISDVRTNPLTADSLFGDIGTVSLIGVPIIRNGLWHAGFYVNHAEPRDWTEEEIQFVRNIGESTWDAVERARAEKARRESEERLTLALEAGGGIGTWDWDIPNDRVYCHPRFAALFSIDPAKATIGTPISEFVAQIHPDDRPRVAEQIQLAVDTGGDFVDEYRVLQTDGSERWIHARGRCHRDGNDNPCRFPGVAFDITGRKLAGEVLLNSERQFQTLAESIPQLAWMGDEGGNLFWYNRRWYDYTGTNFEEMAGWGWRKVHDPNILPDVIVAWKKAIENGEPFEMVFPLKGANGAFRSFLTRIEPVKDTRGRVVRWFGTNTDITKQLETERDLRHANTDLQQFAFAAAHDLQEPLRMVTSYTQLLSRHLADTLDEDSREYMNQVVGGAKRMSLLLHDLLAYTEASRDQEGERTLVDLNSVLSSALSNLQGVIQDSGAVVDADYLPTLLGNEIHLTQLFQNLINNAIKYRSEAAPHVRISARQSGLEWTFRVRDNGLGIPPEYRERIFGVFKRLHGKEIPGTGIGLAICQRVVQRQGGRIWVESEGRGRGSTFCFTFPVLQTGVAQ